MISVICAAIILPPFTRSPISRPCLLTCTCRIHSSTLALLHICALPTELPTCKHCTHCTHVQCIQHILLDANFFDKPYLHPMLLVLMTSLQVDPGAKGEVKSMLCKSIKLLWWCPSIQMHLQVSRCKCKCPDAQCALHHASASAHAQMHVDV